MDAVSPPIANLQPTTAIEPRQRPLYHPAVAPQALAGIDRPSYNARRDVSRAQSLPAVGEITGLVRMQLVQLGKQQRFLDFPTWPGNSGLAMRLLYHKSGFCWELLVVRAKCKAPE